MRIKIKDIPDEGKDWESALDAAFLADALSFGPGAGADLAQSHAVVTLNLYRADDNVITRGKIAGVITLPCSRCLTSTPMLLDVPLRITFTPEDEVPDDEDVSEDEELATHDRNFLQLDDVLREAFILAVPMVPLCKEDCLGLCPVCGNDKNTVPCTCDPRPPDPRLAALRDLKI